MSSRTSIEDPIGRGCEACDERGKWRFLCSYHEGWFDSGADDRIKELEATITELQSALVDAGSRLTGDNATDLRMTLVYEAGLADGKLDKETTDE